MDINLFGYKYHTATQKYPSDSRDLWAYNSPVSQHFEVRFGYFYTARLIKSRLRGICKLLFVNTPFISLPGRLNKKIASGVSYVMIERDYFGPSIHIVV